MCPMTVRVLTDSCSDIPKKEAKKLGITIIPAYLRFGNEVYRDGVDIDCDKFYSKLAASQIHPSTAVPSPGEFTKVYEEAAQETNEIISIHPSKKLSAMYNTALLAKKTVEERGCRIVVIDS